MTMFLPFLTASLAAFTVFQSLQRWSLAFFVVTILLGCYGLKTHMNDALALNF